MKARTWVTAWPWLTMMPERIGIIGKTQGVKDSSRPKPKKLAIATQNPLPLSSWAMRPLSSPVFSVFPTFPASFAVLPVLAGAALKVSAGETAPGAGVLLPSAASVIFASCVSGG